MKKNSSNQDKSSTFLSVIVIFMGMIALAFLVMSSNGLISKENGQFGAVTTLSLICLSFGVFSVVTKKAPFRGGLADKDVNSFGYYVMTIIWFAVFFLLAFIAIKKFQTVKIKSSEPKISIHVQIHKKLPVYG